MHLIMFDLDGTLLQTNGVDVDCFTGAFRSVMGIDSIEDDWAGYTYVTDEGIVTEIASRQLNRPATKQEIAFIRVKIIELLKAQAHSKPGDFSPIPGALALMGTLAETENCKIAIATGCWKESAYIKLSTAGFNVDNLALASCDDSHRREEIMTAACTRAGDLYGVGKFETVTYVGDGVWDIRASKNFGCHFIGIGFCNDEKVLRQEGAKFILSDFTDQKAFFNCLGKIWP